MSAVTGRPRILHMAAYGGAYSGSFIPMLEAARVAIESRGWTYEAVFTPGVERHRWYWELRDRGVRVRVAPRLTRRGAPAWTRAVLSEHSGPTLLHTHFSAWDVPASIAAARRDDAAVIWHLHSRLLDSGIAQVRNAARFGLLGRSVARILCVGPGIRDQAIARLAPASRTELLLNGIDLSRFAPMSISERREARTRLGLSAENEVLLAFTWDWESKGGPLLLDTVRELRRRGRDVHGVVVGSENLVRAESERLDLDRTVHAMAPTEAVTDLYGAADLFIAASVAEGTPFSVLEGLASGTPVVASDIVGHRFADDAMPACRLVALHAGAFADAAEAELDAEPSDRASRLAQTRGLIERDFSLERWTRRLMDIYDDIMARGA